MRDDDPPALGALLFDKELLLVWDGEALKERLTLPVRVPEPLTDADRDNDPMRVVDREALTLRDPVPDTLRDAGTDNDGDRLAPKDTEGDLLGLRDPETVPEMEDVAAGRPNPRVHVGLAVKLPGDGDKLNPAVLEIEAVRDPLEEPDTDLETEMAVVVRDGDMERDGVVVRDSDMERDGVVVRDSDLE